MTEKNDARSWFILVTEHSNRDWNGCWQWEYDVLCQQLSYC